MLKKNVDRFSPLNDGVLVHDVSSKVQNQVTDLQWHAFRSVRVGLGGRRETAATQLLRRFS